ncbi:class I SAM-dependent methyltransferase, partial [Campylobacter jejuni]|nr:class I SAM-dependent methyltransferase [Campylobacter jejuni]
SKKEWGKYPSENVIRFIARNFYNVQDRSKINILELGFGTGANLWFCAKEGFSVSGIEWSKTGLERFKARMKDENLNDKIKQIELGDYIDKLDSFKDDSFDAWMDNYSLAYNDFDKTKKIIDKAMKKLKKGGKFLSVTPSLDNDGFEKDESLGYHLVKPTSGSDACTGIIRYCDEKDLRKLYESATYSISDIKIHIQKNLTKQLNELFIVEGYKI